MEFDEVVRVPARRRRPQHRLEGDAPGSGVPHIKRFCEERELTVMLVVDVSPGAVLALSATRSNDKVGLILFSDTVEKYVPPKKGTRHVLRIIRELLYHEPSGTGTDIGEALAFLNRVTVRRCVCFLLSDFLAQGYETALSIARRRHDLVPIVMTDPRELELPNVGIVEVEDPESGARTFVDTGSAAVRRRFAEQSAALRSLREEIFRRAKADAVEIRTDESYVEPLVRLFRKRERRR
jgi:uncharacterized protein (DUF58 family)